jgi:hypothetical protein
MATRSYFVMMLSQFTDLLFALLIFMFVVMPLVMLWAFALVDLFIRKDIGMAKVIWLIAIIVIPIFGAVIYLLVRPSEEEMEAAAPKDAPAA